MCLHERSFIVYIYIYIFIICVCYLHSLDKEVEWDGEAFGVFKSFQLCLGLG